MVIVNMLYNWEVGASLDSKWRMSGNPATDVAEPRELAVNPVIRVAQGGLIKDFYIEEMVL